jgi:hypothetical protein
MSAAWRKQDRHQASQARDRQSNQENEKVRKGEKMPGKEKRELANFCKVFVKKIKPKGPGIRLIIMIIKRLKKFV